MKLRLFSVGALLVACGGALPLRAGPPKGKGESNLPPPTLPAVKLSLQPAKAPVPSLTYQLFPPTLDQTPGNAASLWLRATQLVSQQQPPLNENQYNWGSREQTPLKDLPRQEAAKVLARYKGAFDYAALAARRERCTWDLPPLSLQDIELRLPELQSFRQLANLLAIRCRLELAEKKYDKAIQTLQTGFTLAKHLGESDTLLHALVGMAVTAIMAGHVEEMMELPDAPNLYWALTALPSPFIDLRKAMEGEMSIVYRSFPALRELEKGPLPPQQVQKLGEDLFRSLMAIEGTKLPDWQFKLGLTAGVVAAYPEAKRALVALGRPAKQVEDMPALQVVTLYTLHEYNLVRDEMFKWQSVPYWQARPGLEAASKKLTDPKEHFKALPFALMLANQLPAVEKVYWARARTDRKLAFLRCLEALRLYAAGHEGKLPAALKDVKEVPIPLDPVTGRDFVYRLTDGKALLYAPAPPDEQPNSANTFHYEVTVKR
jgi:hypothetical protein